MKSVGEFSSFQDIRSGGPARCGMGGLSQFCYNLEYGKRTERLVERMTLEAEAWAEAGTSKKNQIRAYPTARPLADRGRYDLRDLLSMDERPPVEMQHKRKRAA